MKKRLVPVLCAALLVGCAGKNEPLEQGLQFRERLLSSGGCSFTAEITADYGDAVRNFSMDCITDGSGNLTFTVTAPETVAGITGSVDADGGKLTFDGTVLAFPLVAGETLSPVSAPWIMVNSLRTGYLTTAGREGELLHLSVDDSYADDALQLDIWLDDADSIVQADILQNGSRILTVAVTDFQIL